MMMSPMPKLLQRRRRSSSSLVALASASASSTPAPSSRPRYRVAVVGGGVIGLSTALRLAEEAKKEKFGGGSGGGSGGGGGGGLSVSVLARGFGPDTTSSGAGGLWEPYKLGETPSELVNRWSAETLEFLLARAREEEREEEGKEGGKEEGKEGEDGEESSGVIEGPVLQYWTQPAPEDPAWAPVAPGFRRLSRPELEAAFEVAKRGAEENRMRMAAAAEEEEEGEEQQQRQHLFPSFALEAPAIVDGWTFSSAAAQPSRYLSWLARRAERAGVELVARELGSLDELLTFDDDCGEKSGAAAAAAAAADAGEGGRAFSSSSSSSLPRFDAIVNCAGLAGGDLSRDDATPPTPVRGQVARLRPPLPPSLPLSSSSSSSADDKKNAAPVPPLPLGGAAGLFLDEETYLIRNVDFVVAGGTGQAGDADASPRAADRASILARTRLLDPGLLAARSDGGGGGAGGQQQEDWAGLRPLRSPVRLEARWVEVKEEKEKEGKKKNGEKSSSPASSSSVLVVSNYGHGGSGFTLHWGCAGDAAAMVLEGLKKKKEGHK